MVGAEDFSMYLCPFEATLQIFRSYEIVDTPADVLLSCLETV